MRGDDFAVAYDAGRKQSFRDQCATKQSLGARQREAAGSIRRYYSNNVPARFLQRHAGLAGFPDDLHVVLPFRNGQCQALAPVGIGDGARDVEALGAAEEVGDHEDGDP